MDSDPPSREGRPPASTVTRVAAAVGMTRPPRERVLNSQRWVVRKVFRLVLVLWMFSLRRRLFRWK